MARVKAKKKKEDANGTKEEQPEIGPPLRPGLPAFFRWRGYFDVGPGDTLNDIKEFRKRTGRM